jgi:dipeptidyl aminopeptidase/acylaminoacyl peptidase
MPSHKRGLIMRSLQFSGMTYLVLASMILGGLNSSAQVARTEVHVIRTTTVTDQQFLTGDKDGKPTTIGGVLRIPRPGADKWPAVILVHGSSGVSSNVDYWQQQLNGIGVATFVLDVFTGRGIENVNADQGKLGRLTAIIDVYRALAILAAHPRIDPNRIAVMGFSRRASCVVFQPYEVSATVCA